MACLSQLCKAIFVKLTTCDVEIKAHISAACLSRSLSLQKEFSTVQVLAKIWHVKWVKGIREREEHMSHGTKQTTLLALLFPSLVYLCPLVERLPMKMGFWLGSACVPAFLYHSHSFPFAGRVEPLILLFLWGLLSSYFCTCAFQYHRQFGSTTCGNQIKEAFDDNLALVQRDKLIGLCNRSHREQRALTQGTAFIYSECKWLQFGCWKGAGNVPSVC